MYLKTNNLCINIHLNFNRLQARLPPLQFYSNARFFFLIFIDTELGEKEKWNIDKTRATSLITK